MEPKRDEITEVFRHLVETQTPIQVHFVIDGTLIPVEFKLLNRVLKLETPGGLGCISLVFHEGYVDISDYYFGIGNEKKNCPQISHEDFFKISDVVASLYGTKLKLSDNSWKIINGFYVRSSVLSMTKPKGRTFYGKYGFIAPGLREPYAKAAQKLNAEASEIMDRIISFDGDDGRRQLTNELRVFREKVEAEIDKEIEDYTKLYAEKVPANFHVDILDADGNKVKEQTPIIHIVASTLAGGSKKSKKRRKLKRTKKFHYN
jgi:hypothetical protein